MTKVRRSRGASAYLCVWLASMAAWVGCGSAGDKTEDVLDVFAAGAGNSLADLCGQNKTLCEDDESADACAIVEQLCAWGEDDIWSEVRTCAKLIAGCSASSSRTAAACKLRETSCLEIPVLPMTSGTSRSLRGVWGSGPNDVFAVGVDGTIVHYDGNDDNVWKPMDSPTTNGLNAVWGRGPDDVYAVGYQVMLHYDGKGWSKVGMTNLREPLTRAVSVWGTSAHVFVAEETSAFRGRLLRFDGFRWWDATPNPGNQRLSAVWFDPSAQSAWPAQNGWAVGMTTTLSSRRSRPSKILWRNDHGKWQALDPPAAAAIRPGSDKRAYLWGLTGRSKSDVYAVGAYSTALHFDGTSWQRLTLPQSRTWHLHGAAPVGDDRLVAVGRTVPQDDANILLYNGKTWIAARSGALELSGVWTAGDDDVFIVGNKGTILRYNPAHTRPMLELEARRSGVPLNQPLRPGTAALISARLVSPDGTKQLLSADELEWTMSTPDVVSREVHSGIIRANKGPGKTTLRASCQEMWSNALTIEVEPPETPRLATLRVSPTALVVHKGEAAQLTALGLLDDLSQQDVSAKVTWRSSNETVASVNTSGRLTASEKGSAVVTAEHEGVLSVMVHVVVGSLTDTEGFSRATVTPSGKTISVGNLTVDVPSGALSESRPISVARTDGSALPGLATPTVGDYYTIDTHGALGHPARLQLRYDPDDIPEGRTENDLVVQRFGNGTWAAMGGPVDLGNNSIAIYATGPSTYVVSARKSVDDVPDAHRIEGVPYYHQGTTNSCGPTTMSMQLGYYGIRKKLWDILGEMKRSALDTFHAFLRAPPNAPTCYDALRGDTDFLSYLNKFPWGESARWVVGEAIPVHCTADGANGLVRDLKARLSGDHPVVLTMPGHVVVLIGYDTERDLLFYYDPAVHTRDASGLHLLSGSYPDQQHDCQPPCQAVSFTEVAEAYVREKFAPLVFQIAGFPPPKSKRVAQTIQPSIELPRPGTMPELMVHLVHATDTQGGILNPRLDGTESAGGYYWDGKLLRGGLAVPFPDKDKSLFTPGQSVYFPFGVNLSALSFQTTGSETVRMTLLDPLGEIASTTSVVGAPDLTMALGQDLVCSKRSTADWEQPELHTLLVELVDSGKVLDSFELMVDVEPAFGQTRVEGRVLCEDPNSGARRPVPGMQVSIADATDACGAPVSASALTNAQGEYSIGQGSDSPLSVHRTLTDLQVVGRLDRSEATWRSGPIQPDGITPGSPESGVHVLELPVATIKGRVVGRNEQPVNTAIVTIKELPSYEVRTGFDGAFSFPNLDVSDVKTLTVSVNTACSREVTVSTTPRHCGDTTDLGDIELADVTPITLDRERTSDSMEIGGATWLHVTGGCPPYTWMIDNTKGFSFSNGLRKITTQATPNTANAESATKLLASGEACGSGSGWVYDSSGSAAEFGIRTPTGLWKSARISYCPWSGSSAPKVSTSHSGNWQDPVRITAESIWGKYKVINNALGLLNCAWNLGCGEPEDCRPPSNSLVGGDSWACALDLSKSSLRASYCSCSFAFNSDNGMCVTPSSITVQEWACGY